MSFLATMCWKGPMDIQAKVENQKYSSQTLLTYLSEEFLKIPKNPWTYWCLQTLVKWTMIRTLSAE